MLAFKKHCRNGGGFFACTKSVPGGKRARGPPHRHSSQTMVISVLASEGEDIMAVMASEGEDIIPFPLRVVCTRICCKHSL